MDSDFDRAISLHVVDLQCARHELGRSRASDVFLHTLGESRLPERQTALIVVELHVFIDERGELYEIAFVMGVDESGAERCYRSIEWLRVLDFIERKDAWRGLCRLSSSRMN